MAATNDSKQQRIKRCLSMRIEVSCKSLTHSWLHEIKQQQKNELHSTIVRFAFWYFPLHGIVLIRVLCALLCSKSKYRHPPTQHYTPHIYYQMGEKLNIWFCFVASFDILFFFFYGTDIFRAVGICTRIGTGQTKDDDETNILRNVHSIPLTTTFAHNRYIKYCTKSVSPLIWERSKKRREEKKRKKKH